MIIFNVPGLGALTPGTAFSLNDFNYPSNWLELATPDDLQGLGITTEDISDEVVQPEPTVDDYEAAVEAHLNETAKAKLYRSGVSCASYVSSTVPQWSAEATAFIAWRDQVWTYTYTQLTAVQAEQREQPTIAALIAELPEIAWPV